jgi:hypothetical protein
MPLLSNEDAGVKVRIDLMYSTASSRTACTLRPLSPSDRRPAPLPGACEQHAHICKLHRMVPMHIIVVDVKNDTHPHAVYPLLLLGIMRGRSGEVARARNRTTKERLTCVLNAGGRCPSSLFSRFLSTSRPTVLRYCATVFFLVMMLRIFSLSLASVHRCRFSFRYNVQTTRSRPTRGFPAS